jgi:MFS family permease
LLVGLGYAFPWPALASIVVGQVPVSERAAALGALNAFYDLAVAASSAVAGAAAGRWGLNAPFWIALACVGAAVIMVLVTNVAQTPRPGGHSPELWDAGEDGNSGVEVFAHGEPPPFSRNLLKKREIGVAMSGDAMTRFPAGPAG